MTKARRRALAIASLLAFLALIAIGIVAAGRFTERPLGARALADRPALLLVTSLPLMFGEGFSLDGGGSPTLDRLRQRYRIVPIGVTSEQELAKGRLLLMAHPLAQPAEDLVALDAWVRGGGRLLLLADPSLNWPSGRPLGDPLRPPAMFMDTGLLAHWGLVLRAPDKSGEASVTLGRYRFMTRSPGRLSGGCSIEDGGLVAYCRIGSGAAIVIADADFLNAERDSRNLDALMSQLAELESR